jgi:hypothetical protein
MSTRESTFALLDNVRSLYLHSLNRVVSFSTKSYPKNSSFSYTMPRITNAWVNLFETETPSWPSLHSLFESAKIPFGIVALVFTALRMGPSALVGIVVGVGVTGMVSVGCASPLPILILTCSALTESCRYHLGVKAGPGGREDVDIRACHPM